MSDQLPNLHFRLATENDASFIDALAPRLIPEVMPSYRQRNEVIAGLRALQQQHLRDSPPGSYLYICENNPGRRIGLLHLQRVRDVMTDRYNAHILQIALPEKYEAQGFGRAMMVFAETWANQHQCDLLTLNVFPGNIRARRLYEACGFETDQFRLAKQTDPR